MMTPSTACSPSLVNASATAWRLTASTGIRLTEYPRAVAAVAIASSVRVVPKVESSKTITPMLRNSPLRKARAAPLGR